VLYAFNLLSLYQRKIALRKPNRRPATLHTEVFITGAVRGLIGKQSTIKLSSAWGGLVEHKPIPDTVLWRFPSTPPKSNSAPTTGTFAAPIP